MTERTPQDINRRPEVGGYQTLGRLVFWEQAIPDLGRSWAKLLLNRLQLREQAVFVTSLAELRTTIEKHPASFVFAEVTTTHFRELLSRIPQLRRTMPMSRVAIVCLELPGCPTDEYNVFDSLFREAGATIVLATQRDLLAMIPAVLTHFAGLPRQEIGWRESIEQRLPWRNL